MKTGAPATMLPHQRFQSEVPDTASAVLAGAVQKVHSWLNLGGAREFRAPYALLEHRQ
jgi:hypothetical protein